MLSNNKLIAIAVTLMLMSVAVLLHGAYINKIEVQVTQPDGTVLDLFASGDEFHNWLHDENNFTIIADEKTGNYCYAQRDGEFVTASSLVVGTGNPQDLGLTPGINISSSEYRRMRQTKFYSPAERDAPTTGTINNIVIYIRFSDETEFGEPISTYDGWFNSNANSQRNYFLEASYNQLTVNTSFYPAPANNYVVSWQDSQPRAYYQPYNATTNPIGYNGDTERRNREFTLLQNATNGVSSQIPSSLVIDSDGDGRVDNVVYIVRGSAGAWASLLWPHRWAIYDRYVYINGKRVYDFNFQLQTFLVSRSVGVICHEFFHTLGAPDLYHYTDNGISPAGTWDLMNSDQNPPQHMTAFMKYKYGDWISSIPTITADQVYTLNPLTSSTGQCYRINSQDPNQYYVMEFRKKTGTFENSIPSSGLIVYRIDTTAGDGNADGPPDELYIYRPGGTTTVNGTINSANFSSETGRISFNNSTNPTPFLRDGTLGNLYLTEIGSSAGTTMSFRKGVPKIDFSVNPYSQGFDGTAFPPDAWITQSESGSYVFQRVTSGTNPSCSPQSGAGIARYNSDIAPSGNSALLVTPMIECSDPVNYGYQISFYMYRDGNLSTFLDKMEIYVNTSPNLAGSPTQLGNIYRYRLLEPIASAPGWYQYSFALPFAAVGNYYAIFRAVSANGYNMFLDTVKLARVPLAAINPMPSNAAVRVSVNQNFSWQSTGSSPIGYKFYLGTNNPPTNLLNSIDLGNVLSYDYTSDLLPNTTYYWKIVPYNAGGSANDCPIWSFTTIPNHDLTAVSLFGTGYALAGEALTYNMTVKNNGALTQNSYVIRLMSAGSRDELTYVLVNSPLEMDATAEHTLTWNPASTGEYNVYGEVSIAGDEN
ncbi:MAG: M6 family metalloprotease domain-containing protein, partial [Candidatus Cloacimonadaceae bacterium]